MELTSGSWLKKYKKGPDDDNEERSGAKLDSGRVIRTYCWDWHLNKGNRGLIKRCLVKATLDLCIHHCLPRILDIQPYMYTIVKVDGATPKKVA